VNILWHFIRLSSPLYALIAAGYLIASTPWWRRAWSVQATRAVFALLLPAMLFQMMSHQGSLHAADTRVLIVYFGSCLMVFFIGRAIARSLFNMDGVSQSVFGLGGIFSNLVLVGLPVTRVALGDAAVPVVALLIVFNALTLWTLVSVSVEWSTHGSFSPRGIAKTTLNLFRNPILLSIVAGMLFGQSGLALPPMLDTALGKIGAAAGPAALLALGLELAGFSIKEAWAPTLALCSVKLLVQPLIVWLLAILLGLPAIEMRAVVLVASMAVGVNVYLMAVKFQALQGAIAGSIVVSNVFAAFTTPLLLAAMHAAG
jgi:malonate transporter and related proteins